MRSAAVTCTLLLLCNAAAAQQTAPAGQRFLRVAGEALVRVKPDRAELHLGVVTEAKTAAAAVAENARVMERVVAGARKLLAGRGEVSTASYSVGRAFTPPRTPSDQPRPSGYSVRNQVSVRVDDLALVPRLLDGAVDLGANDVSGVTFGLRNPDAAQAEALRLAAEKARGRAAALAATLGVQIGAMISADETGGRPVPLQNEVMLRTSEGRGPDTPIEPGLISVGATVTVTFEALRRR